MKLWPRTLGMQLIAVTAAAVALSNLAVAVWFELGSERLNETALLERVLDRAASTVLLLSAIPEKERETATEALSTTAWELDMHHGAFVPPRMTAEERNIAGRLQDLLPPAMANSPVWVTIGEGRPPKNSREDPQETTLVYRFIVPVEPGAQLYATFYRPPLASWPVEVLAAALAAILIGSLAAAYVARRVTRPLSELAGAAAAAAKGYPAPRIREHGPQDVQRAAIAFNAMTDQVTRTLESQRQLLSAVGHDLRTPITAMRISLEFVEDPEVRDRLQANLEELQELTEAVLSAARGTGGEVKRSVDLAALVESLCADLDDMGEPVNWMPHEPAPLICRPNEIRRAVRNLVENAVSYGGRALVQLARAGNGYDIVIEDNGPGIPEADRHRVFEPFVRLEDSRNVATGGTGLGLTLVKAIAEGHGGGVVLENRECGGLRARLHLPLEAEAA